MDLARDGSPPANIRAEDNAQRHPHIANMHVRSVFANAWRLYKLEPVRVSIAALIMLGPALVLGVGTDALVDHLTEDALDGRIVFVVIVTLIATVLGTLGRVAYAGVLDELVGSIIRGGDSPSIPTALRSLPIFGLIVGDLLVAILAGLAASIGLLPGFVLLSMLSVVGPLINIEHRRAFRAIGRAMRLTAPHLLLTLLTVGVPLSIEVAAHSYLLHIGGDLGLAIELAIGVPFILTVGVMVGLCEVVLAYAMLARDPDSSVAEMVSTSLNQTSKTSNETSS
jgi:hypothetical protein